MVGWSVRALFGPSCDVKIDEKWPFTESKGCAGRGRKRDAEEGRSNEEEGATRRK